MSTPATADYIALLITTAPATIAAIGALITSIISARNSKKTRHDVKTQTQHIETIERQTNGMHNALLAEARTVAHTMGIHAGRQHERDHQNRRSSDAPGSDHRLERLPRLRGPMDR